MRALICNAYGPIEDLVFEERDDPEPGDKELVIDVAAAGINFPDILSIAGLYQDKTPTPFIPGNEASGVVCSIGNKVSRFAVGDRVIVSSRGGAFASKCAAHENMTTLLPDGLNFEEGAGYTVAYGTSYHALKQCARLRAGETLLVLGAAGGVGKTAVELGKAMGATVIAAASSAAKLEFAQAAGADELIDYSSQDLRAAIKELTGGNGVDVVYDPVGGELAQAALRGLAWHGRYLVVGFAAGDIPQFPANLALLKEASIVGVWWGTWAARHPEQHVENMQELETMIANGKIRPQVTESFAIDQFEDAFRVISERRALGKVILRFD